MTKTEVSEKPMAEEICPCVYCEEGEPQAVGHGATSKFISHGCGYATPTYSTEAEAISAHNQLYRALQFVKERANAMDAHARQVLGL